MSPPGPGSAIISPGYLQQSPNWHSCFYLQKDKDGQLKPQKHFSLLSSHLLPSFLFSLPLFFFFSLPLLLKTFSNLPTVLKITFKHFILACKALYLSLASSAPFPGTTLLQPPRSSAKTQVISSLRNLVSSYSSLIIMWGASS